MNLETYNLAEMAQTLFEESGDALFLFDPETEQMLDVNPMAQRMTGYARGSLVLMPINYLFRAEDPGGLRRLRQAYRKTGPFHSQEGYLLRHQHDGLWVPVNLTVTRLHAEPRTLGLITARDISERREAQARLRKTESELRQVLASVSDSIWSVQIAEGRWLPGYCSPVVERITGWPAEHFQQSPDTRLAVVYGDDREAVRLALERLALAQSEGEELEYRIVRPDGVTRWVRDSILCRRKASGDMLRLDGILTDITDRKREESLLTARRNLLELIARGASLPEVLDRLVRAIEEQSPGRLASVLLFDAHEHCLRIGAAPSLPEDFVRVLDGLPIDLPVFASPERLARLFREPGKACGLEGYWGQPILAPGADSVRIEAGHPTVLGVLALHASQPVQPSEHDLRALDLSVQLAAIVIERRQAEEAIRAREARYRSLIENLEQCIFLKDADFRFVAVNPPFCKAVGREAREIVGQTDFNFYPDELAKKYRDDDRLILQRGRRLETEEESMIDGQRRIVRVVKTPVRDEQGRGVGILGIFWDVTEQRTLEAQLRQAQKMEAVGQLAGGVAHDFNNLLTAILGNLSLLGGAIAADPAAQDMLLAAETAALRAANLTRQLLGFARRTLLRPEAINLNGLIDEVVSLLKRTIDPRIELEVCREPELWPALADAGHINQVLMNLCLNARDAMPEGGRLLIQTSNVVLESEKARQQFEARAGEFIRLNVRDTGLGMTEEVRMHLFEPFFTTKGPGKGTGLGLATVFGIVKQHQGWIECDSEPGAGTLFSIYLPRYRPPPPPASAKEKLQEGPKLQGTETILFVDDEPTLCSLGRVALEKHGYRVLVAEDGVEAIEVFQGQRGRIDLVILDLTMPRLSGRDTLRELRALDGAVQVLFASGYSSEQLSAEEHEQIAGFVTKPYRPRELATLVREALDRKKASGERKSPVLDGTIARG